MYPGDCCAGSWGTFWGWTVCPPPRCWPWASRRCCWQAGPWLSGMRLPSRRTRTSRRRRRPPHPLRRRNRIPSPGQTTASRPRRWTPAPPTATASSTGCTSRTSPAAPWTRRCWGTASSWPVPGRGLRCSLSTATPARHTPCRRAGSMCPPAPSARRTAPATWCGWEMSWRRLCRPTASPWSTTGPSTTASPTTTPMKTAWRRSRVIWPSTPPSSMCWTCTGTRCRMPTAPSISW